MWLYVGYANIVKFKKTYITCNYSGTPDLTINIRKREAFATLI